MQGFRGVQKGTVDPHTIHGGFQLLSDLATLADTAADQFPAMLDGAHDLSHRAREVILSQRIGLVNVLQMRQSGALRRDNLQG